MKNSKISIIIPTYKRPETLKFALEGIANQDQSLIGEILIGDNSPKEFIDFNKRVIKDSRLESLIKYIRHDPPLSPLNNQNELARQSKYSLLLPHHDDDRLCDGAIQLLYDLYLNEKDERIILWFGKNLSIDEKGVPDNLTSKEEMIKYGKDENEKIKYIWPWCFYICDNG